MSFSKSGYWHMPAHVDREFYDLSDMGGADDRTAELRWVGTARMSHALSDHLWNDPVQDNKRYRITVDMDTPGPTEDMPWISTDGYIVSDRLRKMIDRYAPGHAVFYPATMRYKKRKLDVEPYWLMGLTHVIDCCDRQLSKWSVAAHSRPDEICIDWLVIDKSRVPSDISLFRVRHGLLWGVIRKSLREIFDGEGITGCQYVEFVQHQ